MLSDKSEKIASWVGILGTVVIVSMRFQALESSKATTDKAIEQLTFEIREHTHLLRQTQDELIEKTHALDLEIARLKAIR